MLENEGVYHELMLYKTGMEKIELEIVRDLNRTYPSHVYFQQRQGPGQRSLFNVLKAYSVYDKKVKFMIESLMRSIVSGWVCSRNGVYCRLIVTVHVRRRCFLDIGCTFKRTDTSTHGRSLHGRISSRSTALCSVRKTHQSGKFTLLEVQVTFCLQDLPNLSIHFERECVHSSMFCFNWFNTIFAYSLPFEHLLRVRFAFRLQTLKRDDSV